MISLSPSFCFALLSVITSGSLPVLVSHYCSLFVLFASVSSSFSPVRLLRLEFRTPYSLVGCSDFLWCPEVSCHGCWFCLFSFLCFSSLSVFRSFHFCSPAFFLTIRRFVLLGGVSLHAALPFSSPLSARSLLLRDFDTFLAVRLH